MMLNKYIFTCILKKHGYEHGTHTRRHAIFSKYLGHGDFGGHVTFLYKILFILYYIDVIISLYINLIKLTISNY